MAFQIYIVIYLLSDDMIGKKVLKNMIFEKTEMIIL